ncbi:MAG: efflux RND transporter permease subunit [Pseudomonadota bacterium]
MKTIARISIERPLYPWLLIVFCLAGGIWGFLNVGRLEDPAFTIKEAIVVTVYPGATAAEVAAEVSEPLESAIQKMGEVDTLESRNRPGVSEITVTIKPTYGGDALEQVWDELRNKVGDAVPSLPPGAMTPIVNDTFGDVYGIFYAVSAPGFSDDETHEIANFLRREILAVDGVADVEVRGLPEEAIYVLPRTQQLANLGIPPGAILQTIANSDRLEDAGSLRSGQSRLRIEAPEGKASTEALAGLSIGFQGEVITLSDIASVERKRVDEPRNIVRHDGVEAFTIGVSGVGGRNIVDVGFAVDERLEALQSELPYGVEIASVYEQHVVVEEASNSFLVNLALSVAIVIGVLAIFMGWRAAVVVGTTLLLTVTSTFFFMNLFDIEMERISLGALIIAMGMLVDNAIVVAEGMQTDMNRGTASVEAAEKVAAQTGVPLLGATVIGVMAFAGIGSSPDDTGEFLFSLFAVIAISLMMSWVLAVTVTPLLANALFRVGIAEEGSRSQEGLVFRAYGGLLRLALKARWIVVPALIATTGACIYAFGFVQQQFFPYSTTPLLYMHYKLAQGASIQETAEDLRVVEEWLMARPDVTGVTTTVGQGATRFMLTYTPESPDPSYGQLIIRMPSGDDILPVKAALEDFVREALPHAEARTERLVFGPGTDADIEARFGGKDPDVLRTLAREASDIMAEEAAIIDIRANWRERSLAIQPDYASDRAQAAGIAREDLAQALLMASDGIRAGLIRDEDRLIPILLRLPEEERQNQGALVDQIVYSEAGRGYVPVAQVIDSFDLEVRDGLIHRRDRLPTITVQADAADGLTAAAAFSTVRERIEAIPLPSGYRLEWGGEYESSGDAQASLGRQLPMSFIGMVLITIMLFGTLRQPLIIWLLVPMSINGVSLGLLLTGSPFTFTALLGLLSLSGMLIKNGIVLVDEIDLRRKEHDDLADAIVAASKSRLRPVILAAGTTILGMIPLLSDSFFRSMSVTIIGGLAFASILTLIAAPVFYYLMFPKARAERPEQSEARPKALTTTHRNENQAEAYPLAAE